jgi:hypothetical protein
VEAEELVLVAVAALAVCYLAQDKLLLSKHTQLLLAEGELKLLAVQQVFLEIMDQPHPLDH